MADNEEKATEVIDIKPKTEAAPARAITAEGDVHEIGSTGDFIARLHTGNIVIDPALAQAAAGHDEGPPLTLAEALQRGDYQAAARMLSAQIARAQNGDFDGMREEDRIRLGIGVTDGEREHQRILEREGELRQYFDSLGGYHDRYGGYYNANAGTYTDKDGGTVDNYGGYTYADGSYKSKFGEYYDEPTNTMHLATGEVFRLPEGMTREEAIRVLQNNVKENGGYDADYIKRSQMHAADNEHGKPGLPPSDDTPPNEVAERAKKNQGADPQSGGLTKASFFAKAGHPLPSIGITTETSAPSGTGTSVSGSKFPAGGTGGAGSNTSGGADINGSHFFAVDSSISSSKFSPPPTDVSPPPSADTPDPPVNTDAARPKPPVPKSAAPG